MTLTVALVVNGIVENRIITGNLIRKYDKVIAIDGGLSHCKSMEIYPDLIVGDLDSVDQKVLGQYTDVPTLRYPVNKDKTDTELGIEAALKWEPEKITLFGALGNRTDHLLYHLHLLQRFAYLIDIRSENEKIFLLKKQEQVSSFAGQTVSLIPLTGPVSGVQTKGLKWDIDSAVFDMDLMSISNVSLGESFTVSHLEGSLFCFLQN